MRRELVRVRRKAPIERGRTAAARKLLLEAMGFGFHFTRVPLATRVHPWLRADKTDMRWVPINEDIDLPQSAPVPAELLYRYIDEASHRVIYHECACRRAFECDHYPVGTGCLLMGDAAVESRGNLCREVDPAEARHHAESAISAGLVPMVGKARIDNYIFDIKDRGRLLTVCFCCECCCWMKYGRNATGEALEAVFPRMHGVSVEVDGDCDGCGLCARHCYIGAMRIHEGRAAIGERCRACGRCASVCPSRAITVRVSDPGFLEHEYERIRRYVDHGA